MEKTRRIPKLLVKGLKSVDEKCDMKDNAQVHTIHQSQ